jgi:DNA-binding SARP family transcriptional activator/tetratricopeptide (TPR) repeat protein
MVELLLLGKPVILVHGRALKWRDRKGTGLIAYLALEGPTSRDKLADLLWSDHAQTEARRNLRQRLYEMKDHLPASCLATDGDTISLNAPFQTDLERFRTHLASGDDEAAIALWRGTPLEDLEVNRAQGFEDWLHDTRERWQATFQDALRRTAATRENNGDLRGALALHERLLGVDALQEAHQREVMRLLNALGERDAALRQFEQYREVLKRELEEVPLPQTQQLAERIKHTLRRGQDTPTTTAHDASLVLELRAPLTGRDADWKRLESVSHGLLLIVGEPGVGKTRLAEELVQHLARRSTAPVALRGREGSSGSPLYPVAETLRQALREPRPWLETLEPVWRSECARLVPEIEPHAAPQPMPSLEGRVRFLEGLSRALTASVGIGGAILLDDLQWFDAATLELTAHLTRRAKDAEVRLVATARGEELERNEAATPILTDLKRDGLLTRHPLEPLEERDVRALIQTLSGGPNFSYRLHAATAGNPFYLLETLRELHGGGQLHVMADGAWTTPFDSVSSSYSELPIPATVRETVLQRVARAGPATRRLLEAASLYGDGFTYTVVGSAIALSEWEGLEALERAVNAQLIETSSQGAYVFNHDLTRRALEDALNPDRRKLIHRKIAETLEGMNGSSAQIAEHFERGEWKERAAKWRVKAGEEASRVYAYEQALEHYEKAIEDGLDNTRLFEVYLAKSKIFRISENTKNSIICAKKMLFIAKKIGSEKLLITSLSEFAETFLTEGNAKLAIKVLIKIIKKYKPESELLSLKRMLASSYLFIGQISNAETLFKEVILRSSEIDPDIIAKCYLSLSEIECHYGKTTNATKYKDLADKIFKNTKNYPGIVRIKFLEGMIFEVKGEIKYAIECFIECKKISKELNITAFYQASQILLAKNYLIGDEISPAGQILEDREFSNNLTSPQITSEFLQCLALYNLKLKDVNSASENAKKAIKISDRIDKTISRLTSRLLYANALIENHLIVDAKEVLDQAKLILETGIGIQYEQYYKTLCHRI